MADLGCVWLFGVLRLYRVFDEYVAVKI